MKSKANPKSVDKMVSYPILKRQIGRSQKSELIILFYERATGIVVHSGADAEFAIGEHSKSWDESLFEIYYGSVELENGIRN